jgi:hypothetical protein
MSKLQEGLTLHSVDLKSATDRFPRELQYRLAYAAGLSKRWITVFESFVSRGFYIQDFGAHYEVGQPMGFQGSFPFLAIGQHGLIRLAAQNLGISAKDRYVVLGDDVVISHDALHKEYRRLLKAYDIPISEHKSISSPNLAEFAGFVITKRGYFKGTKLKRTINNPKLNLDMMLSYCRTQGRIPPQFKRVRDLIPLVYGLREHGGLGLNPLGLSRKLRDLWFDPVRGTSLEMRPKPMRKLGRIKSYLISLLYDDGFTKLHAEVQERIRFLVRSYLDELDRILERKLRESKISFLRTLDCVLDHAAGLDPSFLIGASPYSENVPTSRKWIRTKYPYFFLYEQEVSCLLV